MTDEDLAQTRELAVELARLMSDTRCTNVRVLEVAKLSPVCDFLVIGTGTSARQMKSVAEDIQEVCSGHGRRVFNSKGGGENWVAIDAIDIVVHLFSHEARAHYDLEGLWADASEVKWARPVNSSGSAGA